MGTYYHTLFTPFDISLFLAGKHFKLYEKMGAHPCSLQGQDGTYFAVWAPAATQVEVVGSFNQWQPRQYPLFRRWDDSGIWEGFIPHVKHGDLYKYRITTPEGWVAEKADPFARFAEIPPQTASIVWQIDNYAWNDKKWEQQRPQHDQLNQPISVYEVHLSSWKRTLDPKTGKWVSLNYKQLADDLVPYLQTMQFTHVELMPVMHYPYEPSWGYQITGYYAAHSRLGTPQDLMYLIDRFHQAGIGVILDWVPSHFPADAHGLALFDGTRLYEDPNPQRGYHPDWKSLIFNYGRNEVRSFLISNAVFWCQYYHADGLRIDAVTSMLHLNYSRNEGEWTPNKYGGVENLEAIAFIKELNETLYQFFPYIHSIAEESSSFSQVSHPVYAGGLGFGMKWMMGWMHDTLKYFKLDPVYRQYHHGQITFSMMYAFDENFMLPLSHDEVVHGKGTLLSRMPGDEWQRFAHLRLLFGYMFTHPGAKLLFMGSELGQYNEWQFNGTLDWYLLKYAPHQGIQRLVADLNHCYRSQPDLYEYNFSPKGFRCIIGDDAQRSVLAYWRMGKSTNHIILVVCNFTPVPRPDYRIGLPDRSFEAVELLNTDHPTYWGSGVLNTHITIEQVKSQDCNVSLCLNLPPLAASIVKVNLAPDIITRKESKTKTKAISQKPKVSSKNTKK